MMAVSFAALAIAVATALPAAAAPATHPPAYNQRTQLLTVDPVLYVDPESCISRSISLASGYYHYSITTVVNIDDEWPTIQGGTYTWEDCLIPENGYYVEDSYLLNGPTGTFVQTSFSLRAPAGGGTMENVTWGSSLVPQF
jgi:hypothetical protein